MPKVTGNRVRLQTRKEKRNNLMTGPGRRAFDGVEARARKDAERLKGR